MFFYFTPIRYLTPIRINQTSLIAAVRWGVVIMVTTVILTSCSRGTQSFPRFRYAPAIDASSSPQNVVSHRVKRGDTVYSIARGYGVSLSAVIRANRLQPPYLLTIGQSINIPRAIEYRVKKGDTLFSIAQSNNVSINDLKRMNKLGNSTIIKVDQLLFMPSSISTRLTLNQESSVLRHQPQTRDGLGSSKGLSSWQLLVKRPAAITLAGKKQQEQSQQRSPLKRPLGLARTHKRKFTANPSIVATPALSREKFLLPVKGEILDYFGPIESGNFNDGINIATARGTKVRASENGVVVYTGQGMRTLGNVILIKHAQQYVSAYGHLAQITVRTGQVVTRGQPIGIAGSTGHVSRPQLHFQLRKEKTALNPLTVTTPG